MVVSLQVYFMLVFCIPADLLIVQEFQLFLQIIFVIKGIFNWILVNQTFPWYLFNQLMKEKVEVMLSFFIRNDFLHSSRVKECNFVIIPVVLKHFCSCIYFGSKSRWVAYRCFIWRFCVCVCVCVFGCHCYRIIGFCVCVCVKILIEI